MTDNKLKRSNWQIWFFLIAIVLFTYGSAAITQFNVVEGMITLPDALLWMLSNLFVTGESLEKLPIILAALFETIFTSIAATVFGAIIAIFLGLFGSSKTMINKPLMLFSRFVASLSRNIPVVVWALVLLLSFGQNSVTGFLALFVGSTGFLTRAFIESIDEAGDKSIEGLQATGATYFQIVFKGVLPQCLQQVISWILFMVETNIRNATLIGILTGTGIGYVFDIYYKMLNYNVISLITLCIVVAVIVIDMCSNHVRKVIL